MNTNQLEPLIEVTSIGVGNGATAISKILKEKVTFETPKLELTQIEDLGEKFGDKEQTVTVILNKLIGESSGVVLFIFNPDTADKISNMLTNNSLLNKSALNEMVNIFLGNALKAMEDFLGMRILHSVPSQASDMLGSLMDPVISRLGGESEQVLSIDVKLKVRDLDFRALVLTDTRSTKEMLSRLNDKVTSNGS